MRHVADAGSGDDVGGQSHPANFNHANLALACATAREALLDRAAARLRVAIEQLTATDGVVTVASDASARITYGGLIDGQRFEIPLNPAARRKHPGTWRVLGMPVKRRDGAALATGRFEFVHNVRVDGMLHGRGRQTELHRRGRREAMAGGSGN